MLLLIFFSKPVLYISHSCFFVLCKMKHLAGVLENRPQMRDEKLATSLRREEPVVRFTSLPPLIQTPLVGPKTSIPDTATEAKKEYDRIVAESGVPQVLRRDIFFVILHCASKQNISFSSQ